MLGLPLYWNVHLSWVSCVLFILFKMAAVSKAEYLKRYLSNSTDEEKKKKRKKKAKAPQKFARSTIVDDDVGWNDLTPKNDEAKAEEVEFDNAGEEAPVVYDEDGVQAISLDVYKKREEDLKSKWAPMNTGGISGNKETSEHQPSRHDSTDNSPPRRRADTPDNSPSRRADTPDNSPLRRRADTPDNSPPRRREDTPDNSPSRRRADTPDNSPPRRRRADTPDNSPPRRRRADTPDNSPPRRRRADRADTPDNSPPRTRRAATPDISPPRREVRKKDTNGTARRGHGDSADVSATQGKKAGLLSAEDLKRENALSRKREAERFANMDSSVSGRDAKTVHRDKSGRKRDLVAEEQKKREEELKKAKDDEKFNEWGRGVAQTKEAKEKIDDYVHEASKPLARYKDDKDLDDMLKDQERDDDPMLAYMKKKKATVKKTAGVKAKPTYKGPLPQPNRFGIRPGYRWDGVDRSNGFEKKRFAMLSNKKATETIAHKWSIEDM